MISYVYLLMNILFLNNANLIICSFVLGFLSFEPVGPPRFRHAIDLFPIILVDCPTGSSIRAGAFIASI